MSVAPATRVRGVAPARHRDPRPPPSPSRALPASRPTTRGTIGTPLPRPEPKEVSAVSQTTVSSAAWAPIAEVDPELWAAMEAERHRQTDKIELIASENYVFQAVNEAQGSWLTNKYAEGLPGRRYYGGCEHVDVAENLARTRALALFPGSNHVNVQPHSGAQANMAAYFAVLRPGDRILGMSLAHGGHLTHGSPVNFSGRLYEVHAYGVERETERIDYDVLEAQAAQVRPKMIVAGASAYPRTWDFERMAAIAHGVGALLFVDMAHVAGLVAAGLHPSPFPHADLVTTTTHKTLRGPRGGLVFARADLPRGRGPGRLPGAGQEHPCAGGRQERLPRRPGRPADAGRRRQGGRAPPGRQRGVPPGPGSHDRERPGPGRDHRAGGRAPRQRRDRQPPRARGRDPDGRDRPRRGGPPRRRRHHGQQERHPVRREPAQHRSGIRIGTPATTTPGHGPGRDARRSAGWSSRRSRAVMTRRVHARIREDVRELVARFPVPGLPRDRA